jgi:hypothetical protein
LNKQYLAAVVGLRAERHGAAAQGGGSQKCLERYSQEEALVKAVFTEFRR